MAIVTLILGKSGSGKSASLRNLDKENTAVIKIIEKPLPFKGGDKFKGKTTDNWEQVLHLARSCNSKVVVIDDFQYMLANEFMRRAKETGFAKFTDIGLHAWSVLSGLASAQSDKRIYVLSHTDENDQGHSKMKTIGKMLDDKITLEGIVTIVLRATVEDGKHVFRTKNDGTDTTKAPMGMFDGDHVENDLALVDQAICEYYEINNEVKTNV